MCTMYKYFLKKGPIVLFYVVYYVAYILRHEDSDKGNQLNLKFWQLIIKKNV